MKTLKTYLAIAGFAALAACADNDLNVTAETNNYPFRLVMDADEGGDLPDAEDYGIEVKFADYLGELPSEPITIGYTITGMEGDMEGVVDIDKVVYEVELGDCVYERELSFNNDGFFRTITINPDEDLGTVPESFEIILKLPGFEGAEGSFVFNITYLQTENTNVILGLPASFEYQVLDVDVAGEWELELNTEEAFEEFKTVFGGVNQALQELAFADITGKVKAEFEFGEMKFVIELVETEEVTECKDGEEETETVNKELEIEADYDAEEGELELGGSHVIEDDGVKEEFDFRIEAGYEKDEVNGTLVLIIFKIVDTDHYKAGEELFVRTNGASFTFIKD